MSSHKIPDADRLEALLGARLGPDAVRRRLEAEAGEGKPVAGHSTPFAYAEEWFLGPGLLRAVLSLFGLYARGRANALDIRLQQHALESPRLPAALDGLRILQLSDPHIDVSAEFEAALAERLAGVQCDLSVITGDLRFETRGSAVPALAAMGRLRPLLGPRALLVLGNHDSLTWVPWLEDAGYEVLVNEATRLEVSGASLWVIGIDDAGYFDAADLAGAMREVPADEIRLLLSHSPEIVNDPGVEDCDFVLCGHTHGGQINLPGGWPLVTNARCARRYCAGPWRRGGTQGYTSRGAGTSLLDVRFNCPPEITLHRLGKRA